jgi:hypothetical protein
MSGMSSSAITPGGQEGGTRLTTGRAEVNEMEGARETGSGEGSLGNC